MPRKPRFTHPLRIVRECNKLTQPRAARLLGKSAAWLKKVENGSLPLTRDAAYALADLFGVAPDTISRPKGTPKDLFGRTYTAESAEDWRKLQTAIGDPDIVKHAQLQSVLFAALLKASQSKRAFMRAKLGFDHWLTGMINTLRIGPAFSDALRELTRIPFKFSTTVADVMAHDQLRSQWAFPERPKWSGAVPVEVRGEAFGVYDGVTVSREVQGRRMVTMNAGRTRHEVTVRVAGTSWKTTYDVETGTYVVTDQDARGIATTLAGRAGGTIANHALPSSGVTTRS